MEILYYNNILCATSRLLVKTEENPDGFTSYSNLHKMCSRKGELNVVRPGKGKGNCLLIDFSSLPEEWQEKLKLRIPVPEKVAQAKPFKEKIVADEKARTFFHDEYKTPDDNFLPDRLKEEYSNNAAVLNAIHEVYAACLSARRGKTPNFWKNTAEALQTIKTEFNHSLPKNPRYLQRLYNEYRAGNKANYEVLINGRIGNKNREKINGDILDWVITEMANTRQSIDMIALRYRAEALKQGWETDITAAAFRKRVSEPEVQQMIELKRHGRKGFRKLNGQTFKLKKAQYSNDIWIGDGTALSWYYRVPVYGKNGKMLHWRPAMATTYMVIDGASNKFLGWSTKEGINKENYEMQLEAYRAALRVSGQKPYQLLFDNQGGHKTTEGRNFYSKLAHVYFPTRAYRASGKPVEQAFKNFQTLKLSEFPFWSGFGRPSHSNLNYAPNMEEIEKHVDELPEFEELRKLLDVIVNEWNELDFSGKGSPNSIYSERMNPEAKPVTVDELAEMFWNMQGPKKYYPWGINLVMNGEELTYEVYDEAGNVDYKFRRKHLKQKFFLKYDPDGEYPEIDLYQTHPTGGYQKVATAQRKREVSRSVKYLNEGDRAWIEKQMAIEEEMMNEMDREMNEKGYDEEVKWTSWRNKIESSPDKEMITLHGYDEGSMDVID